MATYADSVAERFRLQRLYPGVACIVGFSFDIEDGLGQWGVRVHDARKSEVKSSAQRIALAVGQHQGSGGSSLLSSSRVSWSDVLDISQTQGAYT